MMKLLLITLLLFAIGAQVFAGSPEDDQIPTERRPLTFEEVCQYFQTDDHEGLADRLDRDGDGYVDGDVDTVWDHIERLYLMYDCYRSRQREAKRNSLEDRIPDNGSRSLPI